MSERISTAVRKKSKKPRAGGASSGDSLAEKIDEISTEALTGLSPEKVGEILRPWLAKADAIPDDPMGAFRLMEGLMFAGCLTLFTPSLTGVAPIARFIRQRRPDADAETALALEALSHADFHLARVKSRLTPDTLLVEDLANGADLVLMDDQISESLTRLDIGAWLAPLPDGAFVVIGPITPLDEKARAEGMAFVRAGKGLSNSRRCAAAIYRHILRHDTLRIEGVNYFPDEMKEALNEAEEAEYDEPDRLDLLIAAYLVDSQNKEMIRDVRRMSYPAEFIEALTRSFVSRRDGEHKVADAFLNVAYMMLETMDRRAMAGHHRTNQSLEALEATIAQYISNRQAPEETRALFEQLRRRLIVARNAGAGADETELARVLQRIQALRAKTTAQGCTEQEALAAAKKVAELLDRYGLSLSEVEMREQPCEGLGIDTGRRNSTPLIQCAPAIAEFCDCKIWFEKTETGLLRFVFFGLPADVAAAHYLYDLVALTFKTETAQFKIEARKNLAPSQRPPTRSFELGLAQGVCAKLHSLKMQRDSANRASNGRDLVLLKESVIDDELEKLGLSFHAKTPNRKRTVERKAFRAGLAAGEKFEPRAGLETQESS